MRLSVRELYLQVEALGVLSGVLVRARSHWSSSSSSSSSVGPPSAAKQPMRTHVDQLLTNRRAQKVVLLHHESGVLPLMSTLPAISMAVVRSHIWMLPLPWPLNR